MRKTNKSRKNKKGGNNYNNFTNEERENLRHLGFDEIQINHLEYNHTFDAIIEAYKDVAHEEYGIDLDRRQRVFNDMLLGIELQDAVVRELPRERREEHEQGHRNYLVGLEGVTNKSIANQAFNTLIDNNNNNNVRQGGRRKTTRKSNKSKKTKTRSRR